MAVLMLLGYLEAYGHSGPQHHPWRGYFCEFDRAYQNQIIGRHIYGA